MTLDQAGLERAYQVAIRRLGTRRSRTVQEIIQAYLGLDTASSPAVDPHGTITVNVHAPKRCRHCGETL